MNILSFDVESNGLHGKGFAIGAVLTNSGGVVEEFFARCPIEGAVDDWVMKNVLPALVDAPETHTSYEAMLDSFYKFLRTHGGEAKVLTFIPWPVEANILSDIFSTPEDRRYQGPFPVIDLATALDTKGHVATSDEGYLEAHGLTVPFKGSAHHPLYDAHAAEVVYRHLMA